MVLNMESYIENSVNLPRDTCEHVIPGGNHAGFADYGLQKGDGQRTVYSRCQQDETVKLITDMIFD